MQEEHSPEKLAQMDYEVALNAVAGHVQQEGYEIAGGEKNMDAPYSLVLRNTKGLTAVKITANRAPAQPTYSKTQAEELRNFAAQNGIDTCAMAPVGLMPADRDQNGNQGFYVKFEGLVVI